MGRISRVDLAKNEEIVHRVNKMKQRKEVRLVDWSQVAWELSSVTAY
jgi:hypothetical protein